MEDLQKLAELIERNSRVDGAHATAIPRVFLHRSSTPIGPMHTIYEPAVCFVAQGRKHAMVNDQLYVYGAGNYLMISVDVPVVSHVVEATSGRPFLTLRLDLDLATIGTLMLESDIERTVREQPVPALAVTQIDESVLDAAIRLLNLLDTPRDIPILAPLAEREILYRLLRGAQTSRLSQIAVSESKLQHVNRAIRWIKHNFRNAFSTELLAEEARMSTSALHLHFKSVTGMSPLQYQKQLRLQEARRLMLSEAADVAIAGHAVGYDSPSQFSREYRRLFGAPPLRDIEALRASMTDLSDA